MKYNLLFLLRFVEKGRKKRAKICPQIPHPPQKSTRLHKSAHFSLCAGGGVRGLVVLAEAGKRIFLRQLAVVAKQRFTTR